MSDKELWAVHLDFGQSGDAIGIVYTIPLGGSIGDKEFASQFLYLMAPDNGHGYDEERDMWEVDEGDLPFGYTFQTYYIARYEVNE